MTIYLKYYFWLITVSLLSLTLERINPWRPEQKVLRKMFWQDIFWLIFNGHYLGLILAVVSGKLIHSLHSALHQAGLPVPESLALVAGLPLWAQLALFFLLKDFIEWNIHRLLHNVPWLWEFHKLHHSIQELDWVGNFRFHWGEIVIYRTLSYLPLVVLGADDLAILITVVFGTFMQNLNHANLPLSYGPLRYLFNSPKMHVWHHDVQLHGKGGQNFGIVLSLWDWMFGTVYWPEAVEQPRQLGFADMESYPQGILGRILYPFRLKKIGEAPRNNV